MTRLTTASVDDLLRLLQQSPPDLRTLYHRWEQEQWEAGAVDFSSDREQWAHAVSASTRRLVLWTLSWFHAFAGRGIDHLVVLADAAPGEEQQVFLTTQLADAARHVVLYERFYSEVVGDADHDPHERLDDKAAALLADLAEAVARIGRDDTGSLVEAVLVHHVVLEGSVTLPLLRFLVDHARRLEFLPGLCDALTASAHDHVRHTQFALRFLGDAVGADEKSPAVLMEHARRMRPSIGRFFAGVPHDAGAGEGGPSSAEDPGSFADSSLTRLLQAIGAT